MGRMLDALKALDSRNHPEPERPPAAPAAPPPPDDWESLLDDANEGAVTAEAEVESPAPPPARKPSQPTAPHETCMLPAAPEIEDFYLEMAGRIGEQLASNYSNVLLFVGADRRAESGFSMTQLAQAFAVQAPGDVLLVDGDLREGRLSHAVARPGPGTIEAMLGQAQWPDIIHPTQLARVDFVACGTAQVPTFERPEFGWSALRPLYRAVLIGVANQSEPETNWLAARCDAVYYVLSRPHTRRSSASAAVNVLRSAGANVVGCIVVND
jgi:Mrp family chromosome partitioning ATPase